MKIWWCSKHEKKRTAFDDNCWFDHRATNCVIVSMRLIPDDAETVERIAQVLKPITVSGPLWARQVLADFDGETP